MVLRGQLALHSPNETRAASPNESECLYLAVLEGDKRRGFLRCCAGLPAEGVLKEPMSGAQPIEPTPNS